MSARVDLKVALAGTGEPFATRIHTSYVSLRSAVADSAWDAAGLRAGIFCEAVLRFLQQTLTGASTPFGDKLPVFTDECARLQRTAKSAGPESFRLLIPRALDFIYTLRNKRGVGHAGGDVEANQIDAVTAARVADWCVCELLRVTHSISLEEAQAIVDWLAERHLPEVWAVLGKKRVLNAGLDYKSQVLLLLHGADATGVAVEDLREWVEHERPARFVERVIAPLHSDRLVEYDHDSGMVLLSPTGATHVEEALLPRLRSKP